MGGIAVRLFLTVPLLAGVCACSKHDPAPPTQPPMENQAVLYAVPPWVSVGIGGIQHVNVSGGVPPYTITSEPGAIATVSIADADSAIAVLKIMGVAAASASTSVTVRDNTPSSPKTVSIPVTVF